jgi:hypothetical protein
MCINASMHDFLASEQAGPYACKGAAARNDRPTGNDVCAHSHACGLRAHANMSGVISYFAPSAIWNLVHDCGLEGTFPKRAERVYGMLIDAYKDRGIPHEQRLPKEEFFAAFHGQTGPNPGAFPEMHGKAAHLHHLVPALCDVCRRINQEQNRTADEDVHRLQALECLLEFDKIVTQGGEVLTDAEADRLLVVVEQFCLHQNFLEPACACVGGGGAHLRAWMQGRAGL